MNSEKLTCCVCQHGGSDIGLVGCGCTFHAQCIPVHLIVTFIEHAGRIQSTAVQPSTKVCPCCKDATLVQGMQLFPMTLDLLDQAAKARKAVKNSSLESVGMWKSSNHNSSDIIVDFISAERSYLFAASGSTTLSPRNVSLRNGRWTEEETEFVDFLVQAFDAGVLPLAAGVRLNDFLCSLLMCKASRLTKKMKNARLGARVYEFKNITSTNKDLLDCKTFLMLQKRFVQSIRDEATSLELRFTMCKTWRQNVFNLCLQVGYSQIDASAWLKCVDAMDRRANEADATIRKARQSTFVCVSPPVEKRIKLSPTVPAALDEQRYASSGGMPFSNVICQSSMQGNGQYQQQYTNSLDDTTLSKLNNYMVAVNGNHGNEGNIYGNFLEEAVRYMQVSRLPFEYIDVWVPNFATDPPSKHQSLRLFHAGHATTHNVRDPVLFSKLHRFGEYSSNFSLHAGEGVAGRVFALRRAVWERQVNEVEHDAFEPADAAKAYGLKTAVGIPLCGATVHCIVLTMYSIFDLTENLLMLEKWSNDLSTLSPRPTWNLIVDFGQVVRQRSPSKHSPPLELHNNTCNVENDSGLVNRDNKADAIHQSCASRIYGMLKEEDACIAKLLECYFFPGSTDEMMSTPELSAESFHMNLTTLHFVLTLPTDLRSSEEHELIAVIRESYRNFSKSGCCSHRELAQMLVKEWCYLKYQNVSLSAEDKEAVSPFDFGGMDWDFDSPLDYFL